MKILYLLFSFTVGGTEKLVTDMCNQMVTNGHDVHLYIVNNHYSQKMLESLDLKVHIFLQDRVPGQGEKMTTLKKVTNYIKENKIDVVHCNTFSAPELLILKPFCFPKTKIVHTIHDVGQYKKLSKWKVCLRNILCNQFIAISESVRTDIISYGADREKVITVYNAVNLDKFGQTNNKKFDSDKIIIGNTARFMPEKKGQDILIEALEIVKQSYPNIMCFFAGGYDHTYEKLFEEYQADIQKRNLDKNIRFLGNVDDIPNFLKQIDIFVLPSRFEGFGISLIEAMVMGIPCVATDLDGPAEILGNNERGYLFKKENSEDLAKKILYVIKNMKKEKMKAKENIEYVKKNFDISNMCQKLIKIYEE